MLSVLVTFCIIFYHLQRSRLPSALLGMCLIRATKCWRPITSRLHRHRVSLVVQRKQNEKCMLGSFRPAVHSHFAFVSALDEALLTLKSPPEGEFNTPAAFQWFSSQPFLLLFSLSDLPVLSLMPRAPFRAEEGAKAVPLKYVYLYHWYYYSSPSNQVLWAVA